MRISGDAIITGLVTAAVGLATAFATWRVGHRQAKADLVTAVQRAAHGVIQDLRDEVARIQADREKLLERDAQCQRDLAVLRAEVGQMRAELAELREAQAPTLL